MEQTKGRRAFCIGLSILIALLVWFYANDDTQIEISVNDVPIEFTNEDTTLADKGLMLLSNEEETIDLKLLMPQTEETEADKPPFYIPRILKKRKEDDKDGAN